MAESGGRQAIARDDQRFEDGRFCGACGRGERLERSLLGDASSVLRATTSTWTPSATRSRTSMY